MDRQWRGRAEQCRWVPAELRARHGLRLFSLEHSCCYEALLLDEERGRLFVGAQNHLLSLALDDISRRDRKIYWPAPVEWREECNWAGKDITCMNFVKILHPYNRTHLYACGTGAFHPVCAFVEAGQHAEEPVFKLDPRHTEDGKGKSPYDPRHTAASVLVGEELYSGVATDLMGRDFTIFRSLGRRPSIRTEQHDSRWLNEPKFVAVFWVPESEDPDDDKIYFFFREMAVERQQGLGKTSFARIGQICRNDMGGQRSLVNKWTTFLKARLVCAVPGPDGTDTHFDELRDVFLLQTRDKRNPLVYAIFSTSSSVFQGSAVCVYTMADIRRAFLGPFAHKEGPNYQWVSYQGRVPYPRPGMCPSKTFGTFGSTKDFPDEVIQFARHHPLMYNPVLPHGQRPLFLQATVPYTFTRIAVDRVTAADGQYDVLFIGTDVGTVLKVVSVPQESWHRMEPLLLEELQVFQDASPITTRECSALLFPQHQLYAGSATALAQLPLHRCGAYGKACAECCLARDPYCAWDGNTCTRYVPNTKRRFRRQDVRNGDPNVLCSEDPRRDTVPQKQLYGVEGSTVFLECIPKSLQAHILWTHQRTPNDPQREVSSPWRVVRTERGVLLRSVQRADAGLYLCHATEHACSRLQQLLNLPGPPPRCGTAGNLRWFQVVPTRSRGCLWCHRCGGWEGAGAAARHPGIQLGWWWHTGSWPGSGVLRDLMAPVLSVTQGLSRVPRTKAEPHRRHQSPAGGSGVRAGAQAVLGRLGHAVPWCHHGQWDEAVTGVSRCPGITVGSEMQT
uniref:Semaphorin 3B n=1 Tax=Cyanistes caeruleus TaxID=156563 RepID=A0A8C0VTH5_CYACU